jgi:hypothetical protein
LYDVRSSDFIAGLYCGFFVPPLWISGVLEQLDDFFAAFLFCQLQCGLVALHNTFCGLCNTCHKNYSSDIGKSTLVSANTEHSSESKYRVRPMLPEAAAKCIAVQPPYIFFPLSAFIYYSSTQQNEHLVYIINACTVSDQMFNNFDMSILSSVQQRSLSTLTTQITNHEINHYFLSKNTYRISSINSSAFQDKKLCNFFSIADARIMQRSTKFLKAYSIG